MKPQILITRWAPAEHFAPLDGVADMAFGPSDGSLIPREAVLEMAPGFDAIKIDNVGGAAPGHIGE